MTDLETEKLLAEFKAKVAHLETEAQTQFVRIENIWERWEPYCIGAVGFLVGMFVMWAIK